MNNKLSLIYWVLGIIVLSVPAFALSPVLWPTAAGAPVPTATQLVFFIIISLIEAMLFSTGLVFLFFGFGVVKKSPTTLRLSAWLFYLGSAWMLLSWWPHDNFHRSVNEQDLQQLLYIEYGFHLTLILAGLAIAYTFFQIFSYLEENKQGQN